MDKLDQIIDSFIPKPTLSAEERKVFYRCDQDEYYVVRNPDTEQTTYIFDVNKERFETTVPDRCLQYYLDSGYWVSIRNLPEML
jgi:hypothetical protein